MGYKKDALKGISWMSGFRVVTRVLAFLKVAVLARVLSPSQFGVFGIASLVLVLLEMLTETGINIILVQSKRNITEFINSAWVVSIIRGVAIALLIIISSPFIASFFHTPESLGILLFMSLVPLVRGFINPAVVTYQKELAFGSEFWFRTTVFFFDAIISIIFTLMTHSVYSLVVGLLAGALLEVVLSFVLIKVRPKFEIQKEYFSEIFHKGKWITAYGVFNYIAENGDNIVVGKVMGASSLGLYQMAYKISLLPISEVSDVICKVVFPVYAKISSDKKRLLKAYYKTVFFTLSTSFLIGGFIFLFPTQIITILLGEKWLATAPVLQILAVYGALRTTAGPASALFLAVGKQSYVTLMIFIRFFGLAVTIYPLVSLYGLMGAGYSALISVLVEIPIVLYLTYLVFKNKKEVG